MKQILQFFKPWLLIINQRRVIICLFLFANLAFLNAQTIVETMDAYRDNTIADNVVAGHLSSWSNDVMPIYTSIDGQKIVNYVGDLSITFGIGKMMTALKFSMPQTSATLASAKLYLNVYGRNGSPFAKISLASDNDWAEAADGYSTFPDTTNLPTLISQSVTATGWNSFSLPVANIQTAISSVAANTMSLLVRGSSVADNYFNFYSDNDAKNSGGSTSNNAYLVLDFLPQVANVSVPANGIYKIGDVLNFTVNFDYPVTVVGSPALSLNLNTGGTVSASYVSGSGGNSLTFSYTIASGNLDFDGISVSSLSLNGGTIKSAGGTNASLTLNNVASTTNVLIDGVAPFISSVTSPGSATYIVGQNLDYTVNFSEAVYVLTTGGIPYLTLTLGSTMVHAAYYSGTGSSALTFRYTVTAGDEDINGVALSSNVALNGGTIKDLADNAATVTFSGSTAASVLVDGVAPSVANVVGPTAGTYAMGDMLSFTATFSENVTVSGYPYILVNVGGSNKQAVYASGSGSTSLVFRYTLASGDYDNDGVASASSVTLNSGTIKDASGNNATLSFTAPTTTAVLVDGVAPTISNFLPPTNGTYKAGQNLDYTINFSEAVNIVVTGGTPYLTLTVGNSTVHAAYLSGSGTTALVFRYTVVSGDADADGVALSSNITLNGGTIKDVAGNNATLIFTGGTATGVLIDAIAPTVSIISTASSLTNVSPIPVTITFSESVTGFEVGDITVTNGTAGNFNGSGTTYTADITPTQQGDVKVNVAGSVAQDAVGNNNTAASQRSFTFDNMAPSLSIGSTAADPVKTSPIPITITFSESVTGFEVGDITVTNGTAGNFSGSGYIYTADITPTQEGAVKVDVAGSVAQDAAGNNNTAATQLSRTFEIIPPTVSFTTASQSTTNESGTFTITAQLSAATTNAVIVPFTINASSTATGNGTDYSITESLLTIPAGSTSAEVSVNIVNDAFDENDETLIVDMGTPTNANLGTITSHTITITDDDVAPSVNFASSGSNGQESVSDVNLSVNLSSESGLPVTVDFAVTGTATANGTDFTLANGTLVINAGNTANNISITNIVDDLLVEGDETVIVTLSNPVNATLGSSTVYTYTIVDNDNATDISNISKTKYSVYPNPFTSYIRLENTSNDIVAIAINDLSGRTVCKTNFHEGSDIDVSSLKSGVYLLNIVTSNGEKQTLKITKE
jgi:hypothetical protein